MDRKVSASDLVGAEEIADRLGTHRQTVHLWAKRYADFPAPVAQLKKAKIWAWSEVFAWCERNDKPERR